MVESPRLRLADAGDLDGGVEGADTGTGDVGAVPDADCEVATASGFDFELTAAGAPSCAIAADDDGAVDSAALVLSFAGANRSTDDIGGGGADGGGRDETGTCAGPKEGQSQSKSETGHKAGAMMVRPAAKHGRLGCRRSQVSICVPPSGLQKADTHMAAVWK